LRGKRLASANDAYPRRRRTTRVDELGHNPIDSVDGDGKANAGVRARRGDDGSGSLRGPT
jgi:hypothetical protein